MGIGDTHLGVKVRLRDEREGSRLPAMTVVFYVEVPTGSTKKQTGSGLRDYWLYGVLQKALTRRTTMLLNGGVLFAGNSSTGLIGTRAARGQVFTGNGSLVRHFTPKLKLGVELFGGVTNNFNLTRGQLEAQLGEVMPCEITSRSLSAYLLVASQPALSPVSNSASPMTSSSEHAAEAITTREVC